jgi:Fe-S-cluster containining protein
MTTDLLGEHRAALQKIDEAVARAAALAGDELACRRGCASCCVDGLSVLPVEAALIEAVFSEPVFSEPVLTEPVLTEPVLTEPVLAEPVLAEPALTEAATTAKAPTAARAPRPPAGAGRCAFLDDEGACSIYAARPVLCRTHGLALKAGEAGEVGVEGAARPGLRVLAEEVSCCELNYGGRAPAPAEVLDATRVLALLVTVDRRFRARAGISDDTARVPLRELAGRLRPTPSRA